MRNRVVRSFLVSLEWRAIAFVITNVFFWITTGHFWKAAGLALLLQLILFVAYLIWHLCRNELGTPPIPSFITRRPRARSRISDA
ncbi:TPA: hypothetical protein DIS55_01500 [Candidatus Kaiserbacteria bacterium]|uniref:DUF2061 domain-containing protein n=1 Tax=Candidatus Kaiserbacteria bacterium RIFCSPLOWO2_12_FULL_50_28 TaxID=1798527 RepID=A0A1F6FLS8_9BACT|nr:MAG: hypothetical protein A3H15_00560 [Candidatus Kaiserbacteria bacterium RIFCSPLOWO2_12_FULL_50_28]HCM43610.1 hypothetical protein [Candidatus Kaiserbacteria bacterium]